jgi:hypothetical protein
MSTPYHKDDTPPAISRDELAYRLEWQAWRGSITQQINMLEKHQTLQLQTQTAEIKQHLDAVIAIHEAEEMDQLKKINTFMFQTKIVGALAVIGLAVLSNTGGFL